VLLISSNPVSGQLPVCRPYAQNLAEDWEAPVTENRFTLPNALQRFQESDEVILVLLREVEIEARVVEIDRVQQGSG
jgi:hypothetical protein